MVSIREEIKKLYKKEIEYPGRVFKHCYDSKKNQYIVIMSIPKDAHTNKERKDIVNKKHAEYRADKLMVVKIININNSTESIKQVEHIPDGNYPKTMYIEGKIVYSNSYDEDINDVCSNGIHFYEDIDTAFWYGKMPNNYTGEWKIFCCDGKILGEANHINGLRDGVWTIWHYNHTQKRQQGTSKNGKNIGKTIYWNLNSSIEKEEYYNDQGELIRTNIF